MESSLSEFLLSGFKLSLIGMGIVFMFLSLLVWIINITSKILQRYSLEPQELPGYRGLGATAESEDAEIVAAISAAIQWYRYR
jgi:oxaloacetate decarboxylase gamma subunit